MGRIGRRVRLLIVVLACGFGSPLGVRAALLTNIGVLDGHTHSGATDVNDAGVVVGVSFTVSDSPPGPVPPVNRAFRYTASGGMQALTPVGTNSVATAVNNAGVIVGWSGGTISVGGFGFHWTAPGPIQNFPTGSQAHSINDSGVIVGNLAQFGVPQHAFRSVGGGSQEDLGVIAGAQSYAYDINEAGVIVGWSNVNATALKKAARYVNGAWSAVPGLSNVIDSEARAINESGDIVGIVGTSGGFRFNNAAGTTAALAGDAADINDAGFAVGSVNGHAALWRPDNTLVDLDAWLDATAPAEGANITLLRANAINNHGLIVGNFGTGGQGAFLLDASALVPEPGSTTALLALVAGAVVRRRRRRRALR